MTHKFYFEINADTHYELGLAEGKLFAQEALSAIDANRDSARESKLKLAERYLPEVEKIFPQYVDELRGYADGAKIAFKDLWALSLESDLEDQDRCTTFITDKGRLIGHNEDSAGDENRVCLLKKTIKDLTVFEIFYLNTLGGNAISINSHGIIQAINALSQNDKRNSGIPRNVIGRWLSETQSPEETMHRFSSFERASGYCHNFIDMSGKVWNLESSATEHVFSEINSPFAHTNHYLTGLKKFEANDNSTFTYKRYESAVSGLGSAMSASQLKKLMTDGSDGPIQSLMNERTVAQMIIDAEKRIASVWLARETNLGWVDYNLDFITKI
jgi:hypothetical protein